MKKNEYYQEKIYLASELFTGSEDDREYARGRKLQIDDMKVRSITPDTHKKRELIKSFSHRDVEKFSKTLSEYEYVNYVDTYSNGNSKILHFGINNHCDRLQSAILANQQKALKKLSTKDSKKTAKYAKFIEDIRLTDLELDSIQEALKNKHEVVLVDVFRRDEEGLVVVPIETHTVLLFQDKHQHQYYVIDPSNTRFSSVLSNYKKMMKERGVEDADNIVVSYKEIKIYSPESTEFVGSHPDQWRDCIDISVKLAFALISENPDLSDYTDDTKVIQLLQGLESIKNMGLLNESALRAQNTPFPKF